MAPSRVTAGLVQSSSSSGIFFQPDGHSQAVINSHSSSSFGNSSTSVPGTARSNLAPVSEDVNSRVLINSVANSGPSVGASSLVTDANSAFSGGAHLQRSASFNNESYMRLPASPLSFSSNNLSISGSSVIDGSSVAQQNAHQDHNSVQGASGATSLPMSQTGQVSLPHGVRLSGSFVPDAGNLSQILSWEFCVRRHEELLPHRLVAPQVNQFVQLAQKCPSTINEGGSEGVSQKDLEANSNMVLMASRQLAKSLELQSLNDLGFSKRYVRISEVVNTMKDLAHFSSEHNIGPIEGLKNYARHAAAARLETKKMQEMEHLATVQGLPTDRNTLNKLMAMHPSLNNQANSSHQMVSRGALTGAAQAALALSTYQNSLARPNPMNSNPSLHQQEASSSLNDSNQGPSTSFRGNASLIPSSIQNSQSQSQQHVLAQRSPSSNGLLHQSHIQGHGNQALQHHMIQQFLQMSNTTRSGAGYGRSPSLSSPSESNGTGLVPSQSDSFKGVSIGNSSAGSVNNKFSERAHDLLQEDSMMQEIANDFLDNGFFIGDFDAPMDYDWKV